MRWEDYQLGTLLCVQVKTAGWEQIVRSGRAWATTRITFRQVLAQMPTGLHEALRDQHEEIIDDIAEGIRRAWQKRDVLIGERS